MSSIRSVMATILRKAEPKLVLAAFRGWGRVASAGVVARRRCGSADSILRVFVRVFVRMFVRMFVPALL